MESENRKVKRDHPNDEGGGSECIISYLPECIMSLITSFLPTEDCVRMSFVSKGWNSLWSPGPPLSILDLDFERFSKNSSLDDDRMGRFCGFVESMIKLHKDRRLQELRLAVDISEFGKDNPQVNDWVRTAMTSDCTTLDMDFSGGRKWEDFEYGDYYSLPECSLELESVRDLRLQYCRLIFSDVACFDCITTAVLKRVDLPDQSLYHLVEYCRELEELHLIECKVPEYLDIVDSESNLKCLVIDSCKSTYFDSLHVGIPSLSRFKFVGSMMYAFYIEKPGNLIEAEINFEDINFDDSADEDEQGDDASLRTSMMHKLLKNLNNVNILTLSRSSLVILICEPDKVFEATTKRPEMDKYFPPPLPNLKHLTLQLLVGHDRVHFGILMQSCNVETLTLDLTADDLVDEELPDIFDAVEELCWEAYLFPRQCLNCLKKIEIRGFEGRTDELFVLKVFLKNSEVLEEMVIHKEAMESRYAAAKLKGVDKKERKLLKAIQEKSIEKLLNFSRGSNKARIVLV